MSEEKKTFGKQAGDYLVKVLNGMAQGLFASLIIGLIIKQIGVYTHLSIVQQIGMIAQYLTGPAIGVGVALSVGASPLAVFSAAAAGAIGAGTFVFDPETMAIAKITLGEPMGAMLASLVGAELGKRIAGKTKVDILLVPLTTILTGAVVGITVSPIVAAFMKGLGNFINYLTTLYPFPMGILVSVVVGMVLTLPISSAAVCISLGLNGLAAGAATVGCCAQMIGFAAASYRENKIGGFIAQGVGTSMLQIPNIVRNWKIWIAPTLAAAIVGPLATCVFHMENNSAGAGMGTSGFVGQINTFLVMGPKSLLPMLLLHFILPAAISFLFSELFRKKGWIKFGDQLLK